MRHVSRSHRVALDWLFDRINLDLKIQIKYIDTKNQLADMLTNGSFTRDEWNNLHNLFNVRYFSFICCSQNLSLTSCTQTMTKRMQEQEGEERIVAKSKPTTIHCLCKSSTEQSPIASKNPGILKAHCRNINQAQGDLEQDNTIEAQLRVPKRGEKMQFWMRGRRRPGTLEFP